MIADSELTRRRSSYFKVRVRIAVRSLKHVDGRGMTLRGIGPRSSYAGHHPRDRDRRKQTREVNDMVNDMIAYADAKI